ncbi:MULTISPECIES: ComF family protein [unclassified Roseitalea]|uniref:ComF family protein n=1 Tax=unclassified Roseitalea TaxID=2639107 RepID=UPI00273F3F90|nr:MULTISPECIES: ComF family protein [unclassified Roseitalea]
MRQWAHKASRATAAVLFPDACLACGRHVDRQGGLCTQCWPQIAFIERPYCAVTGAPFAHDFGDMLVSAEAMANPPDYERARAACVHAAIARQLATRLKYGDRTHLAPWMARWMVRAGADLLADCDVIVPVPLHRLRFWRRRYNQSAELARAVGARTGLPMQPAALVRRRATRPQVGLTARQRDANVRGVFAVPEGGRIAVAGRRILLIDDVLTTGATINAAARALNRAGATGVDVLTFSRVVPGRDG